MTERDTEVVPDEKGRLSRRRVLKALAVSPVVITACTDGGSAGEEAGRTTVTDPTSTEAPSDPTTNPADPEPTPTTAPEPVGAQPGPIPVNLDKAVDTWEEPWTWRPSEYPDESLQLNVIEHETPSVIVGFGNEGATIFGYNGTIPGPTIRVRGDETYRLKVINHLGLNAASAPIGAAPDPAAFPPMPILPSEQVDYKVDWCLGEHSNGVHSVRTTNMHTHGLHVRPGLNPPGPDGSQTFSDDIFARLIPLEDVAQRVLNPDECDIGLNEQGKPLREDEREGIGTYEFELGNVQSRTVADQPHPPGTHWYHPHAHGSTHNQVTSGLAGFLVVEGDVDDALNDMLAGTPNADPALPTGPYDYRERMMFIQRVNPGNVSHDPDAAAKRLQQGNIPAVNGLPQAQTIVMRPGAIERWRLLNGSVDGKGYLRFMVLAGQWVHEVPPDPPNKPRTLEQLIATKAQLLRVDADGVRHVSTTDEIEAAKAPLHQLAADGITLVREREGGPAEYYIKNLDFEADPNPLRQDFTNLADCYRNAETLNACYVRPNELYMSPAQRADFLFQAPQISDCGGEVYTIVGKATAIHTGNEERAMQVAQANLDYAHAQAEAQGVDVDAIIKELRIAVGLPEDTIVAYLVVREFIDPKSDPSDPSGMAKLCEPNAPEGDLPPANFDFAELSAKLSIRVPLPPYLQPILPDEVLVSDAERAERSSLSADGDLYRTRRSTYSGWGAATWPLFRRDDLEAFDPSDEVGEIDPISFATGQIDEIGEVVVAPLFRTMAVDGRKFNPDDPLRPRMGLDTAEEWVVFNNSISVFGDYTTPLDDQIDFTGQSDEDKKARKELIANRSYLVDHRRDGRPVTRAEAEAEGWKITTRGIDHPFHIHINPMWVLRVEVPDENGNLVNVLPEPQWHDVMWLPRNAGRVVFRSRFPDYTGTFVNHCHILLHEDNGMMQEVEIVDTAGVPYDAVESPNYVASAGVIDMGTTDEAVYAPDSLSDAFRQCTRFVDNNLNPARAQEFPAENGVFNPPE